MAVINGTAASETLPGTAAADTITGAGGDDTALMGAGNDVFIWNVDDGSDTVEGGTGKDTLRFNGSNVNELFTIGTLVGGGDAGVGRNIGGGGVALDDVERIELQALGDSDTIRIHDLSPTDVKQLAIDLSNGTPGVGDGAIDTITVDANKANNTITLTQASGVISATGLAAQITLAAAEATDFLEIRSQAGNDKINAAALPASLLLTLDGGEGNDTITGGAGNDTLAGGDGNDTVTGGGGKDFASLGAGNDLFVWNAGDGDDKVEGGDGIDTVRFIGSAADEVITIAYNGGPAFLSDKAAGINLNDVERVEIRPLGGEDEIGISDLTGTDVTAVIVDLAGTSGGATADKKFDDVDVDGTGLGDNIKIASVGSQVVVSGLSAQVSVVHADKTDILNIFGGGGNDTIDGSKLAAGKLALQLFGSIGADTLIGGAGGNDYVDGGDGNDLALLGAGNDFFDWHLGDDKDTIEGQAGTDTARANGDASADVFTLAANGARALVTDNVGNGTMDLNDVERIWIRAESGADAITVNDLSGTDVKLVTLDLGGGGGDLAFDTVTVNGTNGNDKVKVIFPGAVGFTGLPYLVGITSEDVDKDSITFNALGGNDSIDGSKLPAGIIPVALDGGIGNDTVAGGAGDDLVFGGDDNDKLSGAAGDDDLLGGNGNDVVDGGAGADDLSGGNGNDTVTGGTGNDIGLLGAGNDLFIWNVGDGSDTIDAGTDFDTLRLLGSIAGDTIGISANGSQTVLAAPGGATLELNAERIEIRALGGADTIAVGDIATTNVTEIAIDLAATAGGKTADTKIDTVSVLASLDYETVVTTLGSQVAVSTALQEITIDHWGKGDVLVLNGNTGDELLNAFSLAAKSIALQVFAGKGADFVLGGAGNDQITGGDGNDTVSGGAGNDVFIWNPGDDKDIIDGQAGVDTLRVNGDSNSETTSISAVGGHALFSQIVANVVQDLDNVERIEFHAADGLDTITVNDLSGSDVKQVAIDFAAGGVSFGDTVNTNGSAGNDAIKVAVAGSIASIAGLSAQVTVAHELSTLRIEIDALGGNDSVNGSTLKLNSVQSLAVDGGAGNDTITGGLGNDFLSGGDDNDKMLGGGGDDQLFGDNGKDVLDGGTGNDSLTGGAGNDVLTGGVGDDAFTGGEGDDTITGGTGRDELRYTDILDGHDVFIGFDGNAAGGQDTLDLNLLFDNLGVLTADRAGRVSILDNGASVDVFVDTDGINGFDLTVATLKTADIVTVGQDILVGTL